MKSERAREAIRIRLPEIPAPANAWFNYAYMRSPADLAQALQ